jgi:exodeoxyribonuclease-5
MNPISTSRAILQQFHYTPTSGQSKLIELLSEFICEKNGPGAFIIKGYAGTGKTTIVSILVKYLPSIGMKAVLLAPTGRAAKVLAGYSSKKAFTIHKKIYKIFQQPDGSTRLILQKNNYQNALFLVDEASMIASWQDNPENIFGRVNLLDDLVSFVKSGKNCRLVFIGDTAQLPPVMSNQSPALSKDILKEKYLLDVTEFELKEVVRQAEDSGILFNATSIRKLLDEKNSGFPKIIVEKFNDCNRVSGQEAAENVNDLFAGSEIEQSIIICNSNKRANMYNQFIRNRVLFREDRINSGDLLMVVQNNYYWLDTDSEIGFIANGDIVEIKRITRVEDIYGFTFADVTIRMLDYPDEPDLEVKILLETLESPSPALSSQDRRKLFDAVAEDYNDIPNRSTRLAKIKKNPHFNALQVKFAYALTCHKSQGGQWENVFVEMPYLKEKEPDQQYLRWLYTAFTRATKKLFLLNFREEFFEESL